MPGRLVLFAVSITVLFAAGAAVVAQAAGLPGRTGAWGGEVRGECVATDPAESNEKIKVRAVMDVAQNGSDLTFNITPEGEAPFVMQGEIGNGHFWVFRTNEEGRPSFIVGHVKGKGKKLKGTMLEAWDDEVSEIKFKAKRAR